MRKFRLKLPMNLVKMTEILHKITERIRKKNL